LKNLSLIIIFIIYSSSYLVAQNDPKSKVKFQPDEKIVYKTVGTTDLNLHVFYPLNHKKSDTKPVIVFFHGGGWKGGAPIQFYNQSKYFASRGLVAISVQYRTEKSHGTTPKECVMDGKSAIRWIRKNVHLLGVSSSKVIAGGGSAGGHIAAATALIEKYNENGEDVSISSIPNALVLFNPVANNSKAGFGFERVKEYWKNISPAHNLKEGAPPTLIMLGTRDTAFKPHLAKQYQKDMEVLGNRCDLILYKNQVHAFFNSGYRDMHFKTMEDADLFLKSLGYVSGEPNVKEFRKELFPNEK